jgi:hypothetical protein
MAGQMIERTLRVQSREIVERVFPMLRERVFHVTSPARLQQIRQEGFIRANADGALGDTSPQSRISVARQRGFVCLFDLRNKTDDEFSYGLHCFWRSWEVVAILFVAPPTHAQMVMWDDIRSTVELGAMHIPAVECWFPVDLPFSAIDETLIVQIDYEDGSNDEERPE